MGHRNTSILKTIAQAVISFVIGLLVIGTYNTWRRPEPAKEELFPGPGLRAGDALPDMFVSPQDSAAVTVVWMFRPRDLLTCKSPSHDFRLLRQRFGAKVNIVAVAVGDSSAWVPSFLKRERLEIPVRVLSRARYLKDYRGGTLPQLYIVQYNRVVANTRLYTGSVIDEPNDTTQRDHLFRIVSDKLIQ